MFLAFVFVFIGTAVFYTALKKSDSPMVWFFTGVVASVCYLIAFIVLISGALTS